MSENTDSPCDACEGTGKVEGGQSAAFLPVDCWKCDGKATVPSALERLTVERDALRVEVERLREVERAARNVLENYDDAFSRSRTVTPLSFLGIVTLRDALSSAPPAKPSVGTSADADALRAMAERLKALRDLPQAERVKWLQDNGLMP